MRKPLTESQILTPRALFSLGEQPTGFHWVFLKRAVATETDIFSWHPQSPLAEQAPGRERESSCYGKKGDSRKLSRQQTSIQIAQPRSWSSAHGVPPRSLGQVSWEYPFAPWTQQSPQFSNRCFFRSSEVRVLSGCCTESRGWPAVVGGPHQANASISMRGWTSAQVGPHPGGPLPGPVHLRGAAHFPPARVFVPSQILLGFSH